MNQSLVVFVGSVHSLCNDAKNRLAASLLVVNIRPADRPGRVVMSERAELGWSKVWMRCP